MATRTARCRVLRVRAAGTGITSAAADGERNGTPATPPGGTRADVLAVEEPLEIRVNGGPLTVTMRTPGDDIDLAAGFLATEGMVTRAADIARIRMCDVNVADVSLAGGVTLPGSRRSFLTTSACGVCGKDSISAVRVRLAYDLSADAVRADPSVLAGLPGTLRQAQRVFDSTGGLHAAGLFRADGTLLVLREDVGRHNAVDKVVGWALRAGRLPLTGCLLLVSGRASFELVQKAAVAGIPVLAAVSAPSSLAVELAQEAGLTLVGFLRGPSMNVYAGAWRVSQPGTLAAASSASG
jgi:FdhD protein